MIDTAKLWKHRREVQDKKPLVVNITNNVVTNFTANVLLASGASPIMSEGKQESGELARIADVTVLNIGTLHPRQVEYFLEAGYCANKSGTPVVLDPVGVGGNLVSEQRCRKNPERSGTGADPRELWRNQFLVGDCRNCQRG